MVRNQVQGCKKLSRWSIKSKWSEMTLEMSNRIFCDRNYSLNQFQKSLLSWKCPLQLITPSISITFWWCKNVWCCLPVMLPSAWREDFASRRRRRKIGGRGRKRDTRGDTLREDISTSDDFVAATGCHCDSSYKYTLALKGNSLSPCSSGGDAGTY